MCDSDTTRNSDICSAELLEELPSMISGVSSFWHARTVELG